MKKQTLDDDCRVLSIGQPWAELILRRCKPFEIRSWKRAYRGTLLIHASKTWRAEPARELGIMKDDVTFGAIVGVAKVTDIRPFTKADAALLKKKRGGNGSWEPDQFAWVLGSVTRIEPIPFKGQLGLFTPPPAVLQRIKARMNKSAAGGVK